MFTVGNIFNPVYPTPFMMNIKFGQYPEYRFSRLPICFCARLWQIRRRHACTSTATRSGQSVFTTLSTPPETRLVVDEYWFPVVGRRSLELEFLRKARAPLCVTPRSRLNSTRETGLFCYYDVLTLGRFALSYYLRGTLELLSTYLTCIIIQNGNLNDRQIVFTMSHWIIYSNSTLVIFTKTFLFIIRYIMYFMVLFPSSVFKLQILFDFTDLLTYHNSWFYFTF